MSAESELTLGSVVQLWPQPVPANETDRLEVARQSTIRSPEADPTMTLLVSIVARTLECPAALIGIMDDSSLWIKASAGLDDRITHIPRDDCICAHTLTQDTTMVVDDTDTDKHFYAGDHSVGSNTMRYYAGTPVRVRGHAIGVVCALDTEPHSKTTEAMKSTLEAVANIVSEVLEQRVAKDGTMNAPAHVEDSDNLSCYLRRRTDIESVDLHASLDGLNLLRAQASAANNALIPLSSHSYIPQQHADKITLAMESFNQLQRNTWVEHSLGPDTSNNGAVRMFEYFNQDKQFSRSVMKILGNCRSIVAQLLDYEDALLYQQVFSRVSSRRELNGQTWVDNVILHRRFGGIDTEKLRVLTHRREYPDGSNVVVAINAEEAYENELLFGWFIAPCGRGGGESSVNVSCITAQPKDNQQHEHDLSLELLRRLNQKVTMTRFFHLPSDTSSIMPSSIQFHLREKQSNDCSRDDEGLKEEVSNNRESTLANSGSIDYPRGISLDTAGTNRDTVELCPENNRAALVAIHQTEETSQLNENEQMLLDLLDKTISTQEILAQRQHEMAGIIDTHGNQLQRISTALQRVESLLFDKDGKPLKRPRKRANQPTTPA
ncbi:unnamed protein product [Phytophthora lilii]|uniref:Unnamed protein product n=1 Tax=Phytophthora lilii TaxID=2077276 RepID=A0A9W6WPJ3_9STRA|nr:unnamed protein product [Phytophthora lilii]